MVYAIVLLTVEKGSVPSVAKQLGDIPEVTEIYSVAGPYDMVAKVQVEEYERMSEVITEKLQAIDEVGAELDTVISVGVSSRCAPDGAIPHQAVCLESGGVLSVNGKTNLGLGRPVATGRGDGG